MSCGSTSSAAASSLSSACSSPRVSPRFKIAIGLPARIGIAASKLAARVAAELPKSPTVVEPGKESEFLAPLPLARLTPELDAATTLERWGIGSIGDLAQLPENEIATRLGELGRELHYAARGMLLHDEAAAVEPRRAERLRCSICLSLCAISL